jgi:hypothetical protein
MSSRGAPKTSSASSRAGDPRGLQKSRNVRFWAHWRQSGDLSEWPLPTPLLKFKPRHYQKSGCELSVDFALHRTANSSGEAASILSRMLAPASAGTSEDRVLDRIDPARPSRRQEMNGSSPGSTRNLKSQLLPMIFPGGINGLPNDGCGVQISPSQTSLDTPPVAILAKRGSLLSDRYGSVAMMVVTADN